jgi:hypothetical protein
VQPSETATMIGTEMLFDRLLRRLMAQRGSSPGKWM